MDVLITELGLDPEDGLSEEEQIIVEQLMFTPDRDRWLPLMGVLSFITEEDIIILQSQEKTVSIEDLITLPELSEPCRILLTRMSQKILGGTSTLHLRQMIAGREDVRYQWRGWWEKEEVKVGVLTERDPGEQDIADYVSIYVKRLTKNGILVFGDHQIHAGYGLSMWRVFPGQKGFESLNVLPRHGNGLSEYRSSHESWALRGIGATFNTSYGKWTASAGTNLQDGFVDSNNVHLDYTGNHNTESSVARKNSVREITFSGMWETSGKEWYLGAINSVAGWEEGRFKDYLGAFSVFGEWTTSNSKLFGEICKNSKNNIAVTTGVSLKYNRLQYVTALRHFPDDFRGIRSNPMAEWTRTALSESGLYQGLRFSPGAFRITVYGDIFTENNTTPRVGYEGGLRIGWRQKQYKVRLQWKQEEKTLEDGGHWFPENPQSRIRRETMKILVVGDLTSIWTLKGQVVKTISGDENGNAIEAQMRYKQKNLSFTGQWIVSHVSGYEARVYIWSVNLPGEMQSRMFSASCHSLSGKVLYQMDSFRIGGRYSMTFYNEDRKQSPNGAIVVEVDL